MSVDDVVGAPGRTVRLVGGVPFRITDFQGAVEWVLALAAGTPRALNVRFLNAWNVALAHRDSGYRSLLVDRGINLPDGMPVAWLLQRRGPTGRPADRIRGPSLFREVMRQGVPRQVRHFLLGGTPEVLDDLAGALTSRYDGVQIVGRFAPPFAPLTDDYLAECVERIRPSTPDLVWVGLGTPKQDYAGDRLCAALRLPVLNVGAAFDFAAGAKREAPVWMQRAGFEWLFRLASEPRRLWRRYLLGNVGFVAAVLDEWAADRRSATR
jgi:N-acetylglucosaminyldiphosphoundecaprenol N-acetyl-beta-D-mannosaminyltransferase